MLIVHSKLPLTKKYLCHCDLSFMQKHHPNFGIISQGVSEYTKLFQVQIIHSRQLPKPWLGQLGLSKCGELFLSAFFSLCASTLGLIPAADRPPLWFTQYLWPKRQQRISRSKCTHTQRDTDKDLPTHSLNPGELQPRNEALIALKRCCKTSN